jgi:hypothetical protein
MRELLAPKVGPMTVLAPSKPGRLWGVLALVAVALPLPFLFTLTVLSRVVLNQGPQNGSNPSAEAWAYGLIAFGGLLFFPVLFLLGLGLAIVAVRRPHRAGRVMGWIAIAVVVVAIPLVWFGYQVWIINT